MDRDPGKLKAKTKLAEPDPDLNMSPELRQQIEAAVPTIKGHWFVHREGDVIDM